MAILSMFYGYLTLWGVNVWVALVIVVIAGAVIGLINTAVQEALKIPSIMATLATSIIFSGLAYAVCRAIPINDPLLKPICVINKLKVLGLPLALYVIVVIAAIFIFLEKKTVVGKYAIAIGGVNIKGGEGTVVGVLIGTFIIIVLKNGMQLMGIDSFYQNVATGVVLFVAVLAFSLFDMMAMRKKIQG